MSIRVVLLVVAGFLLLAVAAAACSPTPLAPAPAEPTTFFSPLSPARIAYAAPTRAPLVAPTEVPTPASSEEIARPSNAGGPGLAASLKGDAAAGQVVFEANCVRCHGQEGKGGVVNPGSDDGTVPPLNPIDETLVNKDTSVFATNLDLFLEHGSTPSGSSPVFSMPDWGDSGKLQPQQIADVIAYVMSLNK